MIAIYARQSIEKKDSLSIESQIEKCIALCKMNDWTDYEIYKDPGFSGKDLNRPDFKRLTDDVNAGKIEYVVCYRLDRISRSMRDFVNLIADFDEKNTRFVSVSENIDTSTSAGRMLMTVIIAMAQMERENIIERVTDNYYFRCNLGYWGGGPAPYGYTLKRIVEHGKKHTVLEVNEEEAEIVRMFFKWYLEPGMSVGKMLDRANEMGLTTRKGAYWTSRVVSDLLFKPLYAPNDMTMYNYFKSQNAIMAIAPEECDGTLAVNLYGKTDKKASKHKRCRNVEDMYFALAKHQPIIDSNTWVSVQYKKKEMLAQPPRRGTGKASILTGLMKCGFCGRAVTISSSRAGTKYFICSTRKNYGSGLCESKMIQQTEIESFVTEDLIEHINRLDQEKLTADKAKLSNEFNKKLNELQIELAKIDDEIANLLEACSSGNTIAIKYLNEKIEMLDTKKQEIQKRIMEIEQKEISKNNRYAHIDFDNILDTLSNGSFEEKANTCKTFIKKIKVFDNSKIAIEYHV